MTTPCGDSTCLRPHSPVHRAAHLPIPEGDPRYNLAQDLIEGDGVRQDRAQHLLDLIERAREVAADLTERLVPEDLRSLGYRFEFDARPLSVLREKPGEPT